MPAGQPGAARRVGRDAFPDNALRHASAAPPIGSDKPQAEIPFVVEAWARRRPAREDATTSTSHADQSHADHRRRSTPVRDKATAISACRAAACHILLETRRRRALTTSCSTSPRRTCPITSDGKAPDLEPFLEAIIEAIAKAMRKAQRAAPKDKKLSQKDVVLDNLDDAIADVSGDGEYRFNERQIFYRLRPIVLEETGARAEDRQLQAIITDYEDEHGEIPGMYREPRGSIYHPHRDETIPLGTLTVEEYERPVWTFNKLVYIEKEGFSEALKDDGWPERHDCALMSSKGFTTRAARDLVDKLAEHDEPVTVFCVHDADASGTMIYQTFQEATKARGARKIKIVNLGLEPWEAVDDRP